MKVNVIDNFYMLQLQENFQLSHFASDQSGKKTDNSNTIIKSIEVIYYDNAIMSWCDR